MSRKSQISSEARSPQLYDVQETFLKAGSYLRNWGHLTQRTYRQAMQSFKADAPFLEDGIPTKSSLDGWVIALKQRGLSPGGINMYARAVNSYLTWLHEEGKGKHSVHEWMHRADSPATQPHRCRRSGLPPLIAQ